MNSKLLYKVICGSHVYGTNTENSDIDYKSVYIQDPYEILCFDYAEQVQYNKDDSAFEIRRFLELLSNANPTTLEMLYTPDEFVAYKSPHFDYILNNKDKFLSKQCEKSFGEYGKSQIMKSYGLNKLSNWENTKFTKKSPLEFCFFIDNGTFIPIDKYAEKFELDISKFGLVANDHVRDIYTIYYSDKHKYHGITTQKANQLCLSSIPKGETPIGALYYNQDGYSSHCKDYLRYSEWLKNRNLSRYVDNKNHGQKYDSKNLSHCKRLLDIAFEIASDGKISLPRNNAAELLKIRLGEFDLEQLVIDAKEMIDQLRGVYEKSSLQEKIDFNFVKETLLYFRKLDYNSL